MYQKPYHKTLQVTFPPVSMQLAALDRLGRPDRESATLLAAVGINPDVRSMAASALELACLTSM